MNVIVVISVRFDKNTLKRKNPPGLCEMSHGQLEVR
jgi:hypothetical protein